MIINGMRRVKFRRFGAHTGVSTPSNKVYTLGGHSKHLSYTNVVNFSLQTDMTMPEDVLGFSVCDPVSHWLIGKRFVYLGPPRLEGFIRDLQVRVVVNNP